MHQLLQRKPFLKPGYKSQTALGENRAKTLLLSGRRPPPPQFTANNQNQKQLTAERAQTLVHEVKRKSAGKAHSPAHLRQWGRPLQALNQHSMNRKIINCERDWLETLEKCPSCVITGLTKVKHTWQALPVLLSELTAKGNFTFNMTKGGKELHLIMCAASVSAEGFCCCCNVSRNNDVHRLLRQGFHCTTKASYEAKKNSRLY